MPSQQLANSTDVGPSVKAHLQFPSLASTCLIPPAPHSQPTRSLVKILILGLNLISCRQKSSKNLAKVIGHGITRCNSAGLTDLSRPPQVLQVRIGDDEVGGEQGRGDLAAARAIGYRGINLAGSSSRLRF